MRKRCAQEFQLRSNSTEESEPPMLKTHSPPRKPPQKPQRFSGEPSINSVCNIYAPTQSMTF